MKKTDLMSWYDPIMWLIFGFEWALFLTAIALILSEWFSVVSIISAIMVAGLAFWFGSLGDSFEKFCHTVTFEDVTHGMSRRRRRKLMREMRKHGDL